MKSPVPSTSRSPNLSTKVPAIGAVTNLASANTEITALASNAETPKVLAKTGKAGSKIPKPRATQNATADSTATSRGSPLSSGVRRTAPVNRLLTVRWPCATALTVVPHRILGAQPRPLAGWRYRIDHRGHRRARQDMRPTSGVGHQRTRIRRCQRR